MTQRNQEYEAARARITNTPHAHLKSLQDVMVHILSLPKQQIAVGNVSITDPAKLRQSFEIGILWGVKFLDCHMDKKNRRVFTITEFGHRFINEIKQN